MEKIFPIKMENISLLGALYYPVDNSLFYKAYRYSPELFHYNNGMLNSRGQSYYENLNCNQMIHQIKVLKNKYLMVPYMAAEKIIKYVIVDHVFSKLVRLADFIIGAYDSFESILFNYIRAINWCAYTIICFFQGKPLPKYTDELEGISIDPNLGLKFPREQIEADNHFISLSSVSYLKKQYDYIVGIALGGISCAAIASCYLNKPLSIIKISYYDERNIGESIPLYKNWLDKGNILLIDDNCGSGATLNKAKQYLHAITDCSISTYATELHWEKFFRCKVYKHQDQIFELNFMTELTPWCFRHFELLNLLKDKEKNALEVCGVTTEDWANYSLKMISILYKIFPEEKRLLALFNRFSLFIEDPT
ncbi:phosphoribosyltransferase family protein [Providencia stuartii]|uniref:phosphoribosyltransferase family protein n=1 Tax=Providencia stuartii TaxID=588 RepID=UPI0011203F4A|nr:phosphoribosyltransferase [Providencia stuartii]